MSQRTLSKKKSLISCKSNTANSDQANSAVKQEESFDDSDINIPFHRPRCPWGRRESYIQKFKKTFFENSISCLSKMNQSSMSRKPWVTGGVSCKDNETWKRPWGNRINAVNCFCTRLEQAKVAPPSRKNYHPDWIENRRNHIVNKFDGFSKNLLKITGKLSQVTIDMITNKIRENLEKNSDNSVENLYSSSFKIPRSNPYSRLNETNRVSSSKFLAETSCIQVALMPSEFNMVGYRNHLYEKSKPNINVYKNKVKQIRSAEPSSIKLRSAIGKKKSLSGKKLLSKPEIESDSKKDSEIETSACRPVSSRENGIKVKVGHEGDKTRIGDNPKCNVMCDKNNVKNEKEKSTAIVQKVVNFCDRPVSADESTLFSINKNLSEDTTSASRPSSVGSRITPFRERSAYFDANIQLPDDRSLTSDSVLCEDEKYEENVDKEASQNYLSLNEKYNENEQESSVTVDSVKSSMHFIKIQETPEYGKKPLVDGNKNNLQTSGKRKFVRDWNAKKLVQPGTECTGTGYSVQLVKLRNYDKKDKLPSSLK